MVQVDETGSHRRARSSSLSPTESGSGSSRRTIRSAEQVQRDRSARADDMADARRARPDRGPGRPDGRPDARSDARRTASSPRCSSTATPTRSRPSSGRSRCSAPGASGARERAALRPRAAHRGDASAERDAPSRCRRSRPCGSRPGTCRAAPRPTSGVTGSTSSRGPMARSAPSSATSAGKGVDAASQMGQLRSALRAFALDTPSPAEVLRSLGRFRTDSDELFATVAVVVIDPASNRARYALAGHPPPLLVHVGRERRIPRGRPRRAARRRPRPPGRGRGARRSSKATCCCSTPTGSWRSGRSSSVRVSTCCSRSRGRHRPIRRVRRPPPRCDGARGAARRRRRRPRARADATRGRARPGWKAEPVASLV